VRADTLANGLIYYIRPNTEPANRAELRLVINAGSVQEEEDQRGLAHFLEHMLFNGTEHFPEQELVDFLERTGMRFGPDVNAYTSFDETVYTLQVPTDSADIMATAFDVLRDWAANATLAAEAVDQERGVIIEEWRQREQNAGGRIRDQILPTLLADSRYADRLPIGDTTTIQNAPPERLRSFYETWYRPDLMAVVVVGDVDVDAMEAAIRTHFADLDNPPAPEPRSTYAVPDHAETLYEIATDLEYPIAAVQVAFKRDAEPLRTVDDYRTMLLDRLFRGMLNQRLNEIERQADAPFLSAGLSRGGLVRPLDLVSLGARVQEDSLLTGLQAVLTEAERARRFGFTPTEWDRQRKATLRAYEQAYEERENTPSGRLAGELVSLHLENEAAPGIAYEYDLVQRLLDEITLEEINAQAAALLDTTNRVVIVTMPEKDALPPPTPEALAAVLDAVQDQPLTPYEDAVRDEDLMPTVPSPVPVAARDSIPELGVTTVTLANGVRVVMKPTDFKADEVRFVASSPGGTSLVADSAYYAASQAAALVRLSGVGAFDRTALEKKLAGQVVSVAPYISELEEGLRGSASPEDLTTLFQLIHLYVTAPRADSSALAVQKNNQRSFLRNRSNTPFGVLQDTLISALYGDAPRRQVPTLDQIDDLDLQDAYRIYQNRFADTDDFMFTFVGNFDPDSLTTLAQTYLGTLPTTPRSETWRDVAPEPPSDIVTKTAYKGQENQSIAQVLFTGPIDLDATSSLTMQALEGVLQIIMREELREERSGIYSPFVNASVSRRPDSTYTVAIGFSCDPERAQELIGAVFAEIDTLQTQGPTADLVTKAKEQLRRSREVALEQNGFWVGTLDYYFTMPGEDPLDMLTYDERLATITADDIQAAARRTLLDDRYVQVVLYPESYAPSGSQ
jgi:zinc protease